MRLLLVLISCSAAFNLAPDNSLVFRDPYSSRESYFGFTIALRRNPARYVPTNLLKKSHSNKNCRLVVGAPRSQSRKPEYRLIKEPGAVFTFNIGTTEFKELVLEFAGKDSLKNLL